MKQPRKRSNIRLSNDPATECLIRTLAESCGSPAKALELYYWSREPGLIEVIRGIVMMPEETRGAIEAFVALAGNTRSIKAELNARGVLTLASSEVARTAALARCAAQDDTEDAPRLLH